MVAARLQALGAEQLLGALVIDRRPLEVEEQELRLDRGGLLVDAREQRAVGGVGGIDREAQLRVGADTADELGDALQLVHRGGQLGAVELGHAARVALGERGGALVGLGQEAVGSLGPGAVDERLEIPGDVLEVGHGHAGNVRGCGVRARRATTRVAILRCLRNLRELAVDFLEAPGIGSSQTRNRAAESEAQGL